VAIKALIDLLRIKPKEVAPLEIGDCSITHKAAHMSRRHDKPLCRMLDVHEGFDGRRSEEASPMRA
jgi:hypothetical protein